MAELTAFDLYQQFNELSKQITAYQRADGPISKDVKREYLSDVHYRLNEASNLIAILVAQEHLITLGALAEGVPPRQGIVPFKKERL